MQRLSQKCASHQEIHSTARAMTLLRVSKQHAFKVFDIPFTLDQANSMGFGSGNDMGLVALRGGSWDGGVVSRQVV
jgi:hypothetical protein